MQYPVSLYKKSKKKWQDQPQVEDQLQRTVADLAAIRNARLKDAEVATKELLKRNKFLQSQLTHPLSDIISSK